MSLDCVITVRGNGTGRGSPRRDAAAPVRDFLTDLTGYYRAVFKHVMSCEDCRPDDVRRRYLARRDSLRKFGGMTTKGLCHLAQKYEADPRKPVDPALVDEFFVRSGYPELLATRRLRLEQEALGLQFMWRRWASHVREGEARPRKAWASPARTRYAGAEDALAALWNAGAGMPGLGEIAEMAVCSEVMLS